MRFTEWAAAGMWERSKKRGSRLDVKAIFLYNSSNKLWWVGVLVLPTTSCQLGGLNQSRNMITAVITVETKISLMWNGISSKRQHSVCSSTHWHMHVLNFFKGSDILGNMSVHNSTVRIYESVRLKFNAKVWHFGKYVYLLPGVRWGDWYQSHVCLLKIKLQPAAR